MSAWAEGGEVPRNVEGEEKKGKEDKKEREEQEEAKADEGSSSEEEAMEQRGLEGESREAKEGLEPQTEGRTGTVKHYWTKEEVGSAHNPRGVGQQTEAAGEALRSAYQEI
jgi:hypothetical protein